MMAAKEKKKEREGSFAGSLIVFLLCVAIILIGVILMQLPVQIPLIGAIIVVCAYGIGVLKIPYVELEQSMIKSLSDSLGVMLLLFTIGPLIAAWIACGTVPYVIYLGLKLISPTWYLAFIVVMCSILSSVTGSSWTTMGTIGVAFMGISIGMGISLPMTAGAILCGSYFGDKISPVSDVVVFNTGITGAPILKHCKSLLYTTLPAILISCIIFFVLGIRYSSQTLDTSNITAIQTGLSEVLRFSPILWIPIIVVIVAIALKVPAIPALWAGVASAGIIAIAYQGQSFTDFMNYLFSGFSVETSNESINRILNRGGMTSMWNIIGVVICPMSFGGLLDRTKILLKIAQQLTGITKGRVGLIATTLVSGIIASFVAADPYIAALIPVKAFQDDFDKQGLDRTVLSRTVSDGGICYAPMVPWGSNGIYAATTLGLSTGAMFPFYFMAFLTPLMAIILAITGIGIFYKDDEDKTIKDVEAKSIE